VPAPVAGLDPVEQESVLLRLATMVDEPRRRMTTLALASSAEPHAWHRWRTPLMASWKLGPALAAGCAIVLKPRSDSFMAEEHGRDRRRVDSQLR